MIAASHELGFRQLCQQQGKWSCIIIFWQFYSFSVCEVF